MQVGELQNGHSLVKYCQIFVLKDLSLNNALKFHW